MRGALVIFIAMVFIGIILYLTDIFYFRKKYPETPQPDKEEDKDSLNHGEGCCGQHLVCEKTSLIPLTDEIIYYDDEELDRFKGISSKDYSKAETEEFREILLTLLPEDVAGWARSLQTRGIEPPEEIRDELLLIVSELRNS